MTEIRPETHLAIAQRFSGEPVELRRGYARVRLVTVPEMAADEQGLVHGGFVFSAADYAAMLAVNDPNVVLGDAEVKFLKPVEVGEGLVLEATTESAEGRKHQVKVVARRGEEVVMEGKLTCFVLDRHVLAPKEKR